MNEDETKNKTTTLFSSIMNDDRSLARSLIHSFVRFTIKFRFQIIACKWYFKANRSLSSYLRTLYHLYTLHTNTTYTFRCRLHLLHELYHQFFSCSYHIDTDSVSFTIPTRYTNEPSTKH